MRIQFVPNPSPQDRSPEFTVEVQAVDAFFTVTFMIDMPDPKRERYSLSHNKWMLEGNPYGRFRLDFNLITKRLEFDDIGQAEIVQDQINIQLMAEDEPEQKFLNDCSVWSLVPEASDSEHIFWFLITSKLSGIGISIASDTYLPEAKD